ncbi:MAG TPA: hypothetical protein H9834_00185 [Candidatus Barnesiella excrementavium]|nr:hypothetical protein [Candidatus Barnesiella excrementavium]
MIPKVIHYCWFSGEKKPRLIRRCIRSWKKVLPDYEIKCWDANSFDFDNVPYVKQAYERKKWAFVADYVRLYALYTEGGIYLDSDVEVYKSFDEFLKYSFFTGTDIRSLKLKHYGIEAAIMGAEKGFPYLKKCLDLYGQLQFIRADGSMDMTVIPDNISPLLEMYGYKPVDETQYLSHNIVVLSSAYFANCKAISYNNIYARHWNTSYWSPKDNRGKIYHFFYNHDLMFIYRFVENILLKMRK